MKRLVILLLVATLFLAGCGGDLNDEDLSMKVETEKGPVYYDESRFLIKTVEYQECNEYIICYRQDDDSITEIVNMGIQESPFYIIGMRLYYIQEDSLISVDFSGEDLQKFYDDSEVNISFTKIEYIEGEWLYCSGSKWQEIYNDPVALDGWHRVPTLTKVKADFSEFQELENTLQ